MSFFSFSRPFRNDNGPWFSLPKAGNNHHDKNNIFFALLWVLIFLVALYLRTSGLFRGLGDQGSIFHPDEAKQILALFNFLNGDYVRYYGSLFYDGYPYGLNHLDEYLLRPVLFFLGFKPPDQTYHLYYLARLLRVVYGMATVVIIFKLVFWLVRDRFSALLAMFLLAIAPLSVTVTHFATGDIGVDLFTALCFLFIIFYLERKRKKSWMFIIGVTVGAAFSAKYNGLLVGIVPAMILSFEYLRNKNIKQFVVNCTFLIFGTGAGIVFFTPSLMLDFSTTLNNIFANFRFIKNYNVPADILAKPWTEKALLSLQHGTPYIISSLGSVAFFASIAVLLIAIKKYMTSFSSQQSSEESSRQIFILSVVPFPLFFLLIALLGKYSVQPFHFSSLMVPLIISVCFLFSFLYSSPKKIFQYSSILFIFLIILDFGRVSWKENFFWRLEDNFFFEQNLPISLYEKNTLLFQQSGKIRSLYLERGGGAVFRNRKHAVVAPYADLWNSIGVAPLPQVPNPIGNNWIFLNGPTFPRNERTLFIHGEGHGKTVQRYLVLPAGKSWPAVGIRSGSYATDVRIELGKATTQVKLEAHQQKILNLEPKEWKVSGGNPPGEEKVYISPITISVPHDDIWLTFITSQKEKDLFNLFGGGQDEPPIIPEPVPHQLEKQYYDALSRIRFMDISFSLNVWEKQRIPLWEVPLPAGKYILTIAIDGLDDHSEITVELEDANGGLTQQQQSFLIKKGLQQIEYSFTKPFMPYQGRFIIQGTSGSSRITSCKLTPDYKNIAEDFETWRTSGVKPKWVSRFGE